MTTSVRTRLADFFPNLYRTFLPEALAEMPVEDERRATCDRCAMCGPEGAPASPTEVFFGPDTKCCTWHPDLANFAVGGLLSDSSPEGAEGRRRILEKIERRIGVTPRGIMAPAKYRTLYRSGPLGFGRARSLVCPYLDAERGACTVWTHRDGVCTTWFCKHVRGEDGRLFWNEVKTYLGGTETLLAAYALRRLGWSADAIGRDVAPAPHLCAEDLDETPPDDATYAALWGDWAGREIELYTRAYEEVRALDRESFARIGGLNQELAVERLVARNRAMREPVLPDPLLKNPRLQSRRSADGAYVLVSYAAYDPTRLRKAVYDLLDYFDGRTPTAVVRSAILLREGLDLSMGLLTKLYQYRVLVAAETPVSP